jgi:hypothetical protein
LEYGGWEREAARGARDWGSRLYRVRRERERPALGGKEETPAIDGSGRYWRENEGGENRGE